MTDVDFPIATLLDRKKVNKAKKTHSPGSGNGDQSF